MDEQGNNSDTFIEKIQKYINTQLELIKLQSLETFSNLISLLVVRAAAIIMLLIFVFVLSIAGAFYLGEVLGKDYYGFLIIAGLYGIAALIIRYGLQGSARTQVANFIIREILK